MIDHLFDAAVTESGTLTDPPAGIPTCVAPVLVPLERAQWYVTVVARLELIVPGTVSDGSAAGQVPETAAGLVAAAEMTGAGGGAVVGGLVVGALVGGFVVGPVAVGLAVGEPVVEGVAVGEPVVEGLVVGEPVPVVPPVPGCVASAASARFVVPV